MRVRSFSAARRASSARASASARLPRMTRPKPNMARPARGMANAVPLSKPVLTCRATRGPAGGRKIADHGEDDGTSSARSPN